MMSFSIIIPAYRERGLCKLVKTVLPQKFGKNMELDKIVIVACDCEKLELPNNNKIELIEEEVRKGKAHSINLALERIESDIILMESADTIPKEDTIEKLLLPFNQDDVGMTTARPFPRDEKDTFLGFAINMIWSLHHMVSLEQAKTGEMVAFRNVIDTIPKKLATDESFIEFIIKEKGYKVEYVPDAIVFNKGPSSVSNLIKQRRRIFNGHLHIKDEYGYEVSTIDTVRIMKKIKEFAKNEKGLKNIVWMAASISVEAWARLLALVDFYFLKKIPYKWEMVE